MNSLVYHLLLQFKYTVEFHCAINVYGNVKHLVIFKGNKIEN